MRRRRQAANQHTRLVIAKAGHGPAPVVLVTESGTFFARHLLAPAHKARAEPAGDDALCQNV